ncbi:MAG: ATP-binding protein [Candidatus Pacebacteria bacterium]|nr:ATP-binding protein [Candidatus Paceibacterota bacterium]
MEKENIITTIGHDGLTGFIVSIETITRRGLFQFDIIGLANKTISESKQRILSAISLASKEKNHYINKKITTLLSPADSKKEGSHFDLPIAISYLVSVKKQIDDANIFSNIIILGELTLSGSVLPVKNISVLIRTGIENKILYFIIPEGNNSEINKFEGIYIWPIKHISEIIYIIDTLNKINTDDDKKGLLDKRKKFLSKFKFLSFKNHYLNEDKQTEAKHDTEKGRLGSYLIDSVEGNTTTKRGLEIALAGRHHMLLVGTPGCGKSLLAKASKELIPKLTNKDFNIFQLQKTDSWVTQNSSQINFREPHHTSSYTEIIGNRFISGEIVLAHNGILFLDELPEFNRRVLESLRQPLENKYIQKETSQIQGVHSDLVPTDFILIACMNPCDCGYFLSNKKKCICTQGQKEKYKRKMNSPLFQRFDICIYIQDHYNTKRGNRTTVEVQKVGKDILKSIEEVRVIQNKRTATLLGLSAKSDYTTVLDKKSLSNQIDMQSLNELSGSSRQTFNKICGKFNFSKREEFSLLRISRTIADLEKSDQIKEKHILEALSYKNKN